MNVQVLRRLAADPHFNADAAAALAAHGIRAPGATPGEALLNHLLFLGKGAELHQTALNYGITAPAPAPAPAPKARTTTVRTGPPLDRLQKAVERAKLDDVAKMLPKGSVLQQMASDPAFDRQMKSKLAKAGFVPLPGMNAAQTVIARVVQIAREMEKAGASKEEVYAKAEQLTNGAFKGREVKALLNVVGEMDNRESAIRGLNERFDERQREQDEREQRARKEARQKMTVEEVEAMDRSEKQSKEDREESWRAHLEKSWDEAAGGEQQRSTYIDNPRRLDFELSDRNLNSESFEGIELDGEAEKEMKEDYGNR